MKKEDAEKLLKLCNEGCEIYYHLKNDDYNGEIPVSISRYKYYTGDEAITLFSESDHPRADIYYPLEADDCHLDDFKVYRQKVEVRYEKVI